LYYCKTGAEPKGSQSQPSAFDTYMKEVHETRACVFTVEAEAKSQRQNGFKLIIKDGYLNLQHFQITLLKDQCRLQTYISKI
jgi:hypothetical protein